MRRLRTFIEFAVKKNETNEDIVKKLSRFPQGTIDGVVFSDKAGGLAHFCEAEDLVDRGLGSEVKKHLKATGNGDEIWNVVRTGDRCLYRLQKSISLLRLQETSGFLFVSGNDYRNPHGLNDEKCNKDCPYSTNNNIRCGQPSSQILMDRLLDLEGAKTGAVVRLNEKTKRATILFSQACPPITTSQWLSQLRIEEDQELFVTIIPALSERDVDRLRQLGTEDLPLVEIKKQLSEADPKNRGIQLAKESMKTCRAQNRIHGFYLYSHDIHVLVELAKYARQL